jgi:hypothetical protein
MDQRSCGAQAQTVPGSRVLRVRQVRKLGRQYVAAID